MSASDRDFSALGGEIPDVEYSTAPSARVYTDMYGHRVDIGTILEQHQVEINTLYAKVHNVAYLAIGVAVVLILVCAALAFGF